MTFPLKPLALVFRSLPAAVHNEMLARVFNHLLKGQAIQDQLWQLNGKRIAIEISDVGRQLNFIIKRGGLYRTPYTGQPAWEVCIRGRLEHFWQLASRAEDPDTLFFRRQLQIEGETETGLLIKNLLDSLEYDWPAHWHAVFGKQLARRLPGRNPGWHG